MTDVNYCQRGGYLVGRKLPLPDDPTDCAPAGTLDVVGCNRLVCRDCRQPVRSAVGLFPGPEAAGRWAEIYRTPDWSASPYLLRRPGFAGARLYACACGPFVIEEYKAVDDQEPPLPWGCAGHPKVAEGARLYGIAVSRGLDWEGLAARAFAGWRPDEVPPEERQPEVAAWVRSLYRRLYGTPMAEALSRAVAACLTHAEPLVRARALRFFYSLPLSPGAERLQELARGDRALFAGHRNPFPTPEPDLEAWLMRAVGERLRESAEAGNPIDPWLRDLVRDEAMAPGKAVPVIDGLAHADARWLAAHAEDIVRATPAAAGAILKELEMAGRPVAKVGARIARVPGVDRAALREVVEQWFTGRVRKEILAALDQAGQAG
jgi:hypothetical protein